MTASLQERLNYLVNYSSQLIFVGGETLSSQTKALEGFLFQQGESTEIAYIAAEPDTEISDIRQQLCHQLLGETSHFYHRPLNECLASLNSFAGPVMIAITRAERLPKQLLQELWELVLQSRFAGNKQHLNVILFGEKQWAKKAKGKLPENSSGSPLLLSTQQASLYQADQDIFVPVNESESIDPFIRAKRHQEQQIEQRPLLSMGAFWAAATLFLLCIFIGVAVWQKGDKLSALFAPLNQQSSDLASTIPNTTKETVSQWETQVSIASNSNEPELIIDTTEVNTAPVPSTSIAKTEIEQAITSVEIESGTTTKNSTQPLLTNEQSPVNSSFQDTKLYPSGHFVIQFAGFKNKDALDTFRRENKLDDISLVYTTKRYGGNWYVLTHSILFDSTLEARDAIAALPDFANKNSVFVKSTDDIIKELRLAGATDTLSTAN